MKNYNEDKIILNLQRKSEQDRDIERSDRISRNKSDNQYEYKPGDWICPNIQCKNQNFARRMYCHLCQEPRPENKPIRNEKVKSPIRRNEINHELHFNRKPNTFDNFKGNTNYKNSRRFDENEFNGLENDNFNNSINLHRNNFFPANNNNNYSEMPIGMINNTYGNPAFNQNPNPFFQNMNQMQQQDFYSPNQNFNDSYNFYNPNPNSFNPENLFQNNFNNNNNDMNFIPNNFPPNNINNSNPAQNFPFFMNQNPSNMMMFPNNDNFDNFNPINQSSDNFPNFNRQLQQSQLFNNNQSNIPINFNSNNNKNKLKSEQFEFNNNEPMRNNSFKMRNFNNGTENVPSASTENKFLNRKRESDRLVEFEEDKQKRYSGTGARNLEYIKIGDWICRRCDNINFSYRTKCHRCKSFFEEAGENINEDNLAEILDERQIKKAKINKKREDLFKTDSDDEKGNNREYPNKVERECHREYKYKTNKKLEEINFFSDNSPKVEEKYRSPTYSEQELIRRQRLYLGVESHKKRLEVEEEKDKLVIADNIKENLQDSEKKSDQEEAENQEDVSSSSKEEINAIDPEDSKISKQEEK